MRKIILTILAFLLIAPAVLAEDLEQITSYQKLKNVTKQDHPAGSNLTMGFSGDEIRFLVFVQNKTEQTQTYKITDILPENLVYQPNTTYLYQLGSGGEWSKVKDLNAEYVFPLQDYVVEINPGIGFYFKFSTVVSTEIPLNNVTLSNFVNVYDSEDQLLKQTVTKVLVPNSTVKQVNTKSVSEDEKDYINKVLEEEQKFIEETFFKLEEKGFRGELPNKEVLQLDEQTVEKTPTKTKEDSTDQPNVINKIILYFVSIILLLLFLFYLQNKFGVKKDAKSKF